jgi:peroxiredoxin
MQSIESVYQKYKDQNVVVLGIDAESEGTMRQFVEQHDYNWTFLLDSTGQVSQTYRVTLIPKSVFIDATGVIRAIQIGAIPMSTMENLMASAR